MRSEQAVAEAAREAAEAVGAMSARRRFTISKFGRHEDGYLHARVVVDGRPWYFHCRFGSWLAPGQIALQTVLREPEGLLGPEIGREVKYVLAEQARAVRAAEAKELARREAEAKQQEEDDAADATHTDGRAVDDSPHGDDRLLDGGDHPGDHGAVRD